MKYAHVHFLGFPFREWLQLVINTWVAAIKTLAAVVASVPHTAYTGMAKSLEVE